MDLEEINKRIQEIEHEIEEGNDDFATLEVRIKGELKNYRGPDEVISFKDLQKEAQKDKSKGFSSGLGELDEIIGGFHKGNLVTITAETGNGKTSFSQFLTVKFSEEKKKTIWFSYEVPMKSFLEKFGDQLPDGYGPKVLNDTSLVWIEARIIEAIVKYNTEVVFIDHLHYLFNLDGTKSVSLEIGNIMRTLKRIAIKYNITIFIIAHTTKIEEGKTIHLNNLRDSSFVGQESDTVIALWRIPEKQSLLQKVEEGTRYTNYSMISVLKNRNLGKLESFKVMYIPQTNTFVEDVKIPTQEEINKIQQ